MLEPGRVVDRYEVLALLGEGGMATVYRVRHTTLGSAHALKVLHPTAPAVAERLLAEGRVQAGLDHPFALTVTDVIDVDGAPGLVMELVEGGTLLDWIEADPPRTERLRVFRQLTEAVATAHERGWVHRDLKPANVLMKEGTGGPTPKVADFGLVKAVHPEPDRAGPRTRGGVAMGTPGYMAPEQIADAATVDARADVYSLGCILVFALTGQPAFEGEVLDVFAAVAAGQHRGLPPTDPLHPLVERCLARDPGARPADAVALLDQLDRALAATPRPAPPTQWTGPVLGAGLAAMGLALACACGGLAVGWLLPGPIPPVAAVTAGAEPLTAAADADPCPLDVGGGRLGYGLVRSPPLAVGAVHVLASPTAVHPRANDRDRVLCTLPAGARVIARERARAPRSEPGHVWLPVYADAVELPPGGR